MVDKHRQSRPVVLHALEHLERRFAQPRLTHLGVASTGHGLHGALELVIKGIARGVARHDPKALSVEVVQRADGIHPAHRPR